MISSTNYLWRRVLFFGVAGVLLSLLAVVIDLSGLAPRPEWLSWDGLYLTASGVGLAAIGYAYGLRRGLR